MEQTDKVAVTEAAKTSLRTIDKNIASVRKTGTAWLTLVQDTIILIVQHSNDHGDCTRAASLVDNMPKDGMRRAGVVQFFGLYGGINVRKNAKTGLMSATRQRDDNGNLIQGDIDACKAKLWYETERGREPPTEFDVSTALDKVNNLITFIDRRLTGERKNPETGEALGPFVTDDLEKQRLRDLMNSLRGVAKMFTPDEVAKREDNTPAPKTEDGVASSERQAA